MRFRFGCDLFPAELIRSRFDIPENRFVRIWFSELDRKDRSADGSRTPYQSRCRSR